MKRQMVCLWMCLYVCCICVDVLACVKMYDIFVCTCICTPKDNLGLFSWDTIQFCFVLIQKSVISIDIKHWLQSVKNPSVSISSVIDATISWFSFAYILGLEIRYSHLLCKHFICWAVPWTATNLLYCLYSFVFPDSLIAGETQSIALRVWHLSFNNLQVFLRVF